MLLVIVSLLQQDVRFAFRQEVDVVTLFALTNDNVILEEQHRFEIANEEGLLHT